MSDEKLLHRGRSFPEVYVRSAICIFTLVPEVSSDAFYEVTVQIPPIDNRGRGFTFPALNEAEVYERDGTGVTRFALTQAGRSKMPGFYQPMLKGARGRIPCLAPWFTGWRVTSIRLEPCGDIPMIEGALYWEERTDIPIKPKRHKK
ncbi:MAG: hypothetical protein V1907_04415 [Candidatus Kerfeldbacteria bacterium]